MKSSRIRRIINKLFQPIKRCYVECIFVITFPLFVVPAGVLLSVLLLIFGTPVVRTLMLAYVIFSMFSTQYRHGEYAFISKRFPNVLKFLRESSGWHHMALKFPATVVKTADIGPGPHLIANHPHGVICIGAICCMHFRGAGWHKLFPHVQTVMHILKPIFYIPFTREYMLLSHASAPEKRSIVNTLQSGRSVLVVPGGSLESKLVPADGKIPIVLKSRMGFVRIAMEQKVPLVPTYTFGEHDLYTVYQPTGVGRRIQEQLRQWFGFSVLLFSGSLGFLPKRKPIKVVVGAAIPTDYEGELTDEMVIAKHKEYKEALVILFNKHRGNFYPASYELTFV